MAGELSDARDAMTLHAMRAALPQLNRAVASWAALEPDLASRGTQPQIRALLEQAQQDIATLMTALNGMVAAAYPTQEDT